MKKTLLLFLLLPFFGFAQIPAATYHIYATNTDSNFRTLESAIARVNSVGIAGNVTLLLDENQTLTSKIIIGPFGNTNSGKLTIKPADGLDITISGNFASGAVINFNNGDNVIIDGNNTISDNKLRIYNTYNVNSSNVSRAGILFYNGSDNNIIRNLAVELNILGIQIGAVSTGIMAGGENLNTEGNNPSNTIQNVTFTKVKQAITIRGSLNTANTGWKILNNKISSTDNNTKAFSGIYMKNVSNYEVSGNTVSGIRIPSGLSGSTIHSGIYLESAETGTVTQNTISNIESNIDNGSGYGLYIQGNNATVSINNISNLYTTSTNTGAFGIRVEGNNATIFRNKINSVVCNQGKLTSGIYTSGDNQLVYNNFILDVNSAGGGDASSQDGFGMYVRGGSNIRLYHNSVKLNTNPISTSGTSAALFVNDGTNFDIRNNIFINAQTTTNRRYAVFFLTSEKSKFTTLNYNNYYSTQYVGSFGSYYNTTNQKTTLADWQQATERDANSKNENPTFSSSLYLDANNAINKTLIGTNTGTVTNDIDDNARVKPYMGAHELFTCVPAGNQIDFGLNSWIGYVYSFTGNTAPNPAYNTLPTGTGVNYLGTVTETTQNFDRNVEAGAVNGATRNFCDPAPTDRFFVRYKMTANITEAGQYNFMLGSDDGVRLYVDGVKVLERWNQHSYTVDSVLRNITTTGTHEFILEYFELDGSSRVQISFGLVKGDQTLPYGDKVWNVYGFIKNDLDLNNVVYAGNFVDPSLNVKSTTYWPVDKSPAAATAWQGAPMPIDNFTVSYRRQGFPCGTYRIELANSDDATQIYLDNNLLYTQSGYTNTPKYINTGTVTTYILGSNSKIEVRLREDGGNANVAVNFVRVMTPYTGSETVNSNSSIEISSTVNLGSDIRVCSCTVKAGATLNIPANRTLTVDEDINVINTGKFVIQSGGSLLQTSTSTSMFTGNAADALEVQRKITVRRMDLTYWSNPITKVGGFTMKDLSPDTLLDKYYIYDTSLGWVSKLNGAWPMEKGIGYSIRAPQNFDPTTPAEFTGIFKGGVPNNGDINVDVVQGKFNLIGNPYPSAINADDLIRGNTGLGTLYFWTHNSVPTQSKPGDTNFYYGNADYAAYNLSGNVGGAKLNGKYFEGYIAVGQGFLAKPSSTKVNFNNTMRRAGSNSQFYKSNTTGELEKNRVWLNMSNDEGAYKQLLVGYIEGATNSIDIDYDATTMGSNNYVDFYSINESKKLAIQGRALPFDDTDVIPLGYKATTAGELTISIDHADGFFDKQAVYLEDATTGKTIDLRTENYKFTTEVGTFADRFKLRYTSKTLGTGDFETADNTVFVSVKSKVVKINVSKENIKDVQIYNISGQSVYTKTKVDSNELQITNLPSGYQVLLVKVILENGSQVTKKIIFN